MLDLNLQVVGAEAVAFAAAPLLALKLRIANPVAESLIHSIVLRCQIQLEVTRRQYRPQEQERLSELFGEPARWHQTLRSMLWTHTSVVVPPFTDSTVVDLPVPCTFDFNVAATKYFYGLEEGEIPLCLLFSGTIFYVGDDGALQVAQIGWDKEAHYRLPVRVWQEMMELYYPNTAWLCLRRDVFERLYQYKRRHGLPTWEHAVERLLAPLEENARS